jgi:hypothetical protein
MSPTTIDGILSENFAFTNDCLNKFELNSIKAISSLSSVSKVYKKAIIYVIILSSVLFSKSIVSDNQVFQK